MATSEQSRLSLREQAHRAECLAEAMHTGQVDKSGRSYFQHVIETADNYVGRWREEGIRSGSPDGETAFYHGMSAAWLHDVVEDTPVTLEMLRTLEFPEETVTLVGLLTRTRDVSSDIYYQRIAGDSIARLIKAADMDSNTRPSRLAMLDEKTRQRLMTKYAKGYERIDMEPRWLS